MGGWRDLVEGFTDAATQTAQRPAPTAPFGDDDGNGGRPRLPGLSTQDAMVRGIILGRIRSRDAAFDPDAVVRGAVEAFTAVEQAWTELDPQRSRQYLSVPLWCSHRARMELYVLHGRRNRLDGLRVRSAAIVGAQCGDGPDRLTVRIAARSADYDVDAAGVIVRGDTTAFDWDENWILERSAPPATVGGGLAPRCPHCGAPLQVDATGCCSTCGVPVSVGSREWLVVAVERCEEEQRRLEAVLGVRAVTTADEQGRPVIGSTVVPLEAGSTTPGAAQEHDVAALGVLRVADPDFHPAALCDHARNAFVALGRAWTTGDADQVRAYLDEPQLASLRQAMDDLRARGLHRLADDPLVDAVRIVAATDAEGFLTIACEVTAELVDADADASGTLVRGSGALQHAGCVLTFRRHDLARSPGSGITVLRCPRCGAPLRASVLEPCPYCRQAVADGGGSWTLVDIGPLDTVHAVQPEVVAHLAQPCPALLAADPSVNVFDVLATARESFFAVEASTANLEATAVSDRMTPRALAAHADRLERLHAAGHRLRLAFLDLTGARITAGDVLADGSMRITVRFAVSGDASEIDAARTVVAGPGAVTSWAEDWDMVRTRPGAAWLVDAMRPAARPTEAG